MRQRKAQRVVPADRLADDVGVRNVEVVEQGEQVFVEHGRTARCGINSRQAEAAQVQRKAPIVPRQDRDLLPPAQMIAATAVQERDTTPSPCSW